MNTRERAALFSVYAGLELKGKITAYGYTAKGVAFSANRSAAAFNRWLNGKVELPLSVLFEACEIIGVSPASIMDAAYKRVIDELGPYRSADEDDSPPQPATPLAAKRGRRKIDVDPAD